MVSNDQQQHESKVGPLQSEVQITLHTVHAVKLWEGRKATDEKKRNFIMGLPSFISKLNNIHLTSSFDDPYADWELIKIEEKLEATEIAIQQQFYDIDKIFKTKKPTQISISDNLNVSPVNRFLISKSPLGFRGAYLLTTYDELVRKILQLRHVGMIGRTPAEEYINAGSRAMRSFYTMVQHYKFAGASRDDMAANNARARAAIEKFGVPPKEILEGTHRSEYAPVIIKRKPAATETVISGDSAHETAADLASENEQEELDS